MRSSSAFFACLILCLMSLNGADLPRFIVRPLLITDAVTVDIKGVILHVEDVEIPANASVIIRMYAIFPGDEKLIFSEDRYMGSFAFVPNSHSEKGTRTITVRQTVAPNVQKWLAKGKKNILVAFVPSRNVRFSIGKITLIGMKP